MKLDFLKKLCNKRNILFAIFFFTVYFFFSDSVFAASGDTDQAKFITGIHAAMQVV
jgi:hypothetical protein